MISKETLNAIYPLVSKLSAGNRRLVPSEHSPIFALNEVATTPVVDSYEEETGFEEAWLTSLGRSPVLGAVGVNETETDAGTQVTINLSTFTRSMDEASELLAQSVRNAMRHARTVASPVISDVIDSMNDYMVEAHTVPEPFEIIDVDLAALWHNPVVLTALDKHESKVTSMEATARRHVPTPSNLAEHVITGAVEFDEAFARGLRDNNITLDELFDYLFNPKGPLQGVEYPFYKTRNKTLLAYLLASILLDKPVPGTKMALIEWETLVQTMINVLGSGCAFMYQSYYADKEAKILHYETDHVNDKVYLNGPVYEQWLSEGGTPEVIFGALLNQRDNPKETISYQSLLDNKKDLVGVWSTYHSSMRILEDTRRLGRIKDGLHLCLARVIADTEEGFMPDNATASTLAARAKEHVAAVDAHRINDMSKLCVDITCDVLFYHTPAKYLINRINDRCEEGMAPDEAATAVMMEYITDWVASGIGIVK